MPHAEVAFVQDPGPCSTDEASSSPSFDSVSSKELKASRMVSTPSRLSSSALSSALSPSALAAVSCEAGLLALGYKQVHGACCTHTCQALCIACLCAVPILTASLSYVDILSLMGLTFYKGP